MPEVGASLTPPYAVSLGNRWEPLVPVQHRVPIPHNVVIVMIVYAWHLEWYAWIGAMLLAF